MVYRAGAGPRGCRIKELTVDRLVEAMKLMRSEETLGIVQELRSRMLAEDGVSMGIESFHNNLPLANMLCEVSLFISTPRLAQIFCNQCNLKMSLQADAVVHRTTGGRAHHHRIPFRRG